MADNQNSELAGIGYGIASGAWEKQVTIPVRGTNDGESAPITESMHTTEEENDDRDMIQVGSGSSIGMDPVEGIVIYYRHDDALLRFRPRLEVRDLNDCMFMPVLNKSLADKVQSIEVFANGYKLAHIGPEDFRIDGSQFNATLPAAFTTDELADPWVRIRPSSFSSAFGLRFESTTPRRMFGHEEIPGPRCSK